MADHIQVGATLPRIRYAASGSQTAFTFPFPIFTAEDLEVWLDAVKQPTAAYAVSGAGISGGGTVLFTVPPAPGAVVTLRRRLAIARLSDYQEDGIIRAKVLNDELDYQTAALQQVAEDTGRAVKRSFLSASLADLTLPEPEPGRAIRWNAAGDGLENSAADIDQAAAATLAHAATATEAATLASSQAASASAAAASASAAAAQAVAAVGAVKVSATDTTATPLASCLTAGTNIALSILDPGGDESLSIAVTGLGSAAGLAVDADAALAADTDARLPSQKAVKAYVDSRPNGVSAAEFAALQQDVVQNYLQDAVTGAWAAGSYGNGGFDAFTADTIGATSTGQTYDGVGKLYANPGTPATSYANADGTGNRAGSITVTYAANGSNYGFQSGTASSVVDGTTASGGIMTAGGSGNPAGSCLRFQFASPVIITEAKLYWQDAAAHGTYKWQGSSNGSSWTDIGAGVTLGGAATQTDTTLAANAAAYAYYQLVGVSGSDSSSRALYEIEFKLAAPAVPADMTLASAALGPAPAASVTSLRLLALWKAIDVAVLNTDITAEATADGTNWSAGTLSDTGLTLSGFKLLSAVIDLSAHAGTIVKYRLKTFNATSQQVKGVALMTR